MVEENTNAENDVKLVGMLAQFDDPHTLVAACDNAREFGYKKMDAYSPFPVHGIDPAIGIKRTFLPFIVLAVGLSAVVIGLGMQYYANAGDWSPIFPGYNFNISGKPWFSLPANIPVAFEVIVLSSAFATFFGMWIMNKLPKFANPLHRVSRFKRATNDRFFLMVEAKDKQFDRGQLETQFNDWGATAIEEVNEDLTDHKMPSWVRVAGLVGLFLLFLPPTLIFRAVGMTNDAPRLHFMPDMDWQEKFKPQQIGPNLASDKGDVDYLFEDLRAMRPRIPGTISRNDANVNSEYATGIRKGGELSSISLRDVGVLNEVRTGLQDDEEINDEENNDDDAAQEPEVEEPEWMSAFPEGVEVNAELLARGKIRFDIYCSVCHGYSGNGDGLVNARAMALNATGNAAWTTAKSLHDPEVKENHVGRIFDTITNGRGTMGPYRDQIPAADRWAIVAYVKALQETGIEPPPPLVPVEEADAEADDTQP